MEFELKFDGLFPVDDQSKPIADAGLRPLENETEAFEAFEGQAQARTSASVTTFPEGFVGRESTIIRTESGA